MEPHPSVRPVVGVMARGLESRSSGGRVINARFPAGEAAERCEHGSGILTLHHPGVSGEAVRPALLLSPPGPRPQPHRGPWGHESLASCSHREGCALREGIGDLRMPCRPQNQSACARTRGRPCGGTAVGEAATVLVLRRCCAGAVSTCRPEGPSSPSAQPCSPARLGGHVAQSEGSDSRDGI